MKLSIFSIFDSKADAYINPFFLPNQALAMRAFADCVNSESHQFGMNPHDYTLFLVGSFDSDSGTFETHSPRSLGNGVEFVRSDARPAGSDDLDGDYSHIRRRNGAVTKEV